jgi:CRP/FNR family cyclic AMP-dependent transcriptional regulator
MKPRGPESRAVLLCRFSQWRYSGWATVWAAEMLDTLTDRLLALGATIKVFEAGEKIFLEEEPGDYMYLVRSGRVDIVTYGAVLENVKPGSIFGEIALIDDGPRSAAAIAQEESEVVQISKPTFLALIQEQPQFALEVMRTLANRIRMMNKYR